MRSFVVIFTVFIVVLSVISLIWKPQEKLIWNRSASAPLGLYWVNNRPYAIGDWAIVSAKSDVSQWATSHEFTGMDWPLIKRVSGVSGDEICRHEATILINRESVTFAHEVDGKGRTLPNWTGCIELEEHQVFLLNSHPDSLDGRYFGPTEIGDLVGTAHKVDLF
ncbi:MAG: S26 family signal peptidase [Pseudomonadota bacterium]